MSLNGWSNPINYKRTTSLSSVPSYAGIYVILFQSTQGLIPCYVGQANDLNRRLSEHQSIYEPNTKLRNMMLNYNLFVIWGTVPYQRDRDGIELYLYNKFTPYCNEQTPPGTTEIPVGLWC